MPTYVRGADTWKVELDGAVFHVTIGEKTTTRKFISPAHARVQYEKVIAAQTAQGFVPLAEKHRAPLQFVAPDDLDALSVHADSLIDQGHFLGELLAVQIELEKLGRAGNARQAELARHAHSLLSRHDEDLFGGFARHVRSVVANGPSATGSAACIATWRLGVIDEVRLAATSKISLSEMIQELAKREAARYLRSIICSSSVPRGAYGEAVWYDRFVVALTETASAFPRLRSLFLGDLGERKAAEVGGNLAAFFAKHPVLEALRVRAQTVELGALALPNLRELELVGRCASVANLARVREARVPLVALTADPLRAEEPFADALACARALPHLERLSLPSWIGEDKVECLLELPCLPKLRKLDVSRSDLASELKQLVDNAERFAHIDELDLRFNDFTRDPDLFRELRKRLPRAIVAGQTVEDDEDEDDAYDSIRE